MPVVPSILTPFVAPAAIAVVASVVQPDRTGSVPGPDYPAAARRELGAIVGNRERVEAAGGRDLVLAVGIRAAIARSRTDNYTNPEVLE